MIDFVRSLIFRDFWLKLLSFVFAVFIWLFVWKVFLNHDVGTPLNAFGSAGSERTYYNIPVIVVFPASEVRAVIVDPSEIRLDVRGAPTVLEKLKPSDIRAQVDLTGIESARGLQKSIVVTVPTGVTVVRMIPDKVEVVIPPK
jgi:hypothetical protein